MPLIKPIAQVEPRTEAEPKDLALAFSLKSRGAPRASVAPQEDAEAPPTSIAEAIMRKRKAAQPEPVMEAESEDLDPAFIDYAEPLPLPEPKITPPRDRIDAIMRRKRAMQRD